MVRPVLGDKHICGRRDASYASSDLFLRIGPRIRAFLLPTFAYSRLSFTAQKGVDDRADARS
jgi:hypothetical protein